MVPRSALFNPITGTETEHDVHDPSRRVRIEQLIQALKVFGPRFGRYLGVRLWRTTGGVDYIDVHSKAEHATAEWLQGFGAMTDEIAGSVFWAIIALMADLTLGRPPTTWILKTNTSHEGGSSGGAHINLSMPRGELDYKGNLNNIIALLKAFVVSLQVLVGAGMVLPRESATSCLLAGEDYDYAISARGFHVTQNSNAAASRNASTFRGTKPIFLARDETLADARLFWRLQICGLDSNILPTSIQLKLDLLLLMAEMAIQGAIDPITIREPSDNALSMRQISLNWRTHLEVEGRQRAMTARAIQGHYYGQAKRFVARYPRPAWQKLLGQWARMLQALDTDDDLPRGNFGHTDWVTKAVLLEQRAQRFERQDRPFCYDQAERLHFAYHGYQFGGRSLCLPLLLARQFGAPGLGRAVNRALWVGPSDTRAWGRGEAVRLGPSDLRIDWEMIGDSSIPPICRTDPRVPTTPALQELLSQWAKERECE